jgi:hypothetical protein
MSGSVKSFIVLVATWPYEKIKSMNYLSWNVRRMEEILITWIVHLIIFNATNLLIFRQHIFGLAHVLSCWIILKIINNLHQVTRDVIEVCFEGTYL